MASSTDPAPLQQLEVAVHSAQALWHRLAASLDTIYKNPSTTPTNQHDSKPIIPLDLARDAATLVRAHTTKLGLLAVTAPFTPSAVLDVLAQLQSGPVLGLASAAEACDPALYTAFFRKELAWRCRRVLLVLADLLGTIATDGAKPPAADNEDGEGRSSLPATGKVWAACDEVLALIAGGVGGHFAKRVDEWRDSMGDVTEELKEWGEQEPEDDDDDDDDDVASDVAHESNLDTENTTSSNQAMLDELMSSGRPIPIDDPHGIRPRLDSTLRRLRLVVLLYQAINKRRFKKLPPFPLPDTVTYKTLPERLDEVARVLGGLPSSFDDLADAFYNMDPVVIDQDIDECFFAAFAAGELLSASWDGSQDEFSEWVERFKTGIKKS
ncbi:hypothetical protein ISF_09135 [Cordyceps fumosorosea ARSEF 2679]|uniref:Cyclin-D1-binding protein 1-like N-terminal domain-containing protein n=1 Tax=Cordyceps fumosorosea (strain ARSEF 2679) TaxID=1081104 RepID=A0A167LDT3_CORFA|nr:hypothetical protein ISF_09135 [Cordyceps fumosorosea ARSEF 2679]OAA52967.1 hypothetical protein ISF_09135 [Cordyceps fumosorosea ARSEF 2679]